MGYWSSSRSRETGESDDGEQEYRSSSDDDSEYRTDAYRTTADIETDIVGKLTIAQARERYDRSADDGEIRKLMQMEEKWGHQVHDWIDEGVPTDAMKSRLTRERFRERRDTPIPWNAEKHNKKSLQRSREATEEIEPAGRTSVPDTVREVITSPGRSLDDSIQRAVEERMGDSLGDVRIHTGPRAAAAADAIDARAFTVGNHVAFGAGEYDPESAEGQHVLAHELAHVRQQTGGALSMLPQDDVALEIDPDPELEREAEETARRVMSGGELGVQRLSDTDVHVQRIPAEVVPQAKAMFEAENRGGGIGSFQQAQNEDRIEHIEDTLEWAIDNVSVQEESLETQEERILDATAAGNTEQVEALESAKASIQERIAELYDHIGEQAEQIGLTDEQREKLYSDQFDGERAAAEIGWSVAKGLVSLVPGMGPIIAALEISETTLRQFWEQTDGSIRERLTQVKQQVVTDYDTSGTRFD